jgi:tetratricopeptide (TPR) repeat protein
VPFDLDDPVYRELLDRVLESGGRVVPFVGAGLSVYGDSNGRVPLWIELLEHLLAEGRRLGLIEPADVSIERAIRSRDLQHAAEMLLRALGEPNFRRVVERELNDAGKPTPPTIDELVAIGWPLIVTTNLDRLISRAYHQRHGQPMVNVTNLDPRKLAAAFAGTLPSAETVLAQIHGDIDIYASWRLTRSDYEQLLRDTGYTEAMKFLFLRRVFFVGFGMQDEDLDVLLRVVAQIYPPGVGEFFALIPRVRGRDPVIQGLIKQNGLRPILYDVEDDNGSDPFCGHRAVYECLAHLALSWQAARAHLDVTLKYFPELDPYMVGREEEISWLSDLLKPGHGGMVQVVGLGGLGKTSLVQQFIEDQRANIAAVGYRHVFGCSFYRADIGQFINDLVLASAGSLTLRLPDQVEQICDYARQNRTLLILDGVETIIDHDRKLKNPYLQRIIDSVLEGSGTVIFTTRVRVRGGVFEGAHRIDIEPLSTSQILTFLDRWGLGNLSDDAKKRLVQITAGHPLALRILSGVLRNVPTQEAVATIERSAVIDISDEVDPLRENRLARVLGSYTHYLEESEISFLACSTVFEAPASYRLVDATLTRRYEDTEVNAPLLVRDLRPIVNSLLERRLLTVSGTGELSSHPTVREYFARYARRANHNLAPMHRFLAAEYLRESVPQPATFDETPPLLMACRHAAACQDWALFDDLFRRRLMRGFRNYLCNNLGAWEECLALARLGDDPLFPAAESTEPVFYPITVARCLKHLGRSGESRAKYFEVLTAHSDTRDSSTAKYVHNLLTLLIWRGELDAADGLVEVNIRALSWIVELWERRLHTDHCFSAFAYLRLLQGDYDAASTLFDVAASAWDGYEGERLWAYDYYPYYRSELVLLADPDGHEDALEQIEPLLAVADAHGWPESICRGHIQAAVVYLDRASRTSDPADLAQADQRLAAARLVPAGMTVSDVAIGHLMASFKAELVHDSLLGRTRLRTPELPGLVEQADALVKASGLELWAPEVLAARGILRHLSGELDLATDLYKRALDASQQQGNVLSQVSPRSLVSLLGLRLGRAPAPVAVAPRADLLSLVGLDLMPADLTACLKAVASDGSPHRTAVTPLAEPVETLAPLRTRSERPSPPFPREWSDPPAGKPA